MRLFKEKYRNFSNGIVLYSLIQLCVFNYVSPQVLTPPYFNLAEGRRIVATATCGEGVPEPELYCKLVGADEKEVPVDNVVVQGQFCDYCDPRNPSKKHPADNAVDGRKTWWQSPPLSRGMSYNEVNLTVELGQEFHVAYVIVKMGNSPRPGVWALERSSDNGQTYSPWQYFANTPGECQDIFGLPEDSQIKADDTVICTTQYSKIVPLEGGEIVVQLVQNRPSANDFFNSTVLQEWTRATNVRFRLMGVKNLLGHLMSIARQDTATTRRYYYSIEEISIGGRCRCNGHADTCTSVDENDPFKLVCDCKHNTCGSNCETCCPGFEQKKWSQSKSNKKFVCEKCNCFGHSDQCVYNETVDNLRLSLDLQGAYEGGGVCQHCQHNTAGINCNKCVNGYYRPWGKELDDKDVCRKCQCEYLYSTGNCEDGTGRCECKPEYTKPNCDSCSFGHFGYPMCRPCDCYPNGTTTLACQAENGQCPCKTNFGGHFCRNCADEFYNFPECKPCNCNAQGSLNNVCDPASGDCKCKGNYGGRTCDQCVNGYYSFPQCSNCDCDIKGTVAEVCDKASGQCLCKPGFGGPRCDACVGGFTGFPDCKTCNCSAVGSANPVCDWSGRCTCNPNFGGKLCNRCAHGFYNYPNCTACNCNSVGSEGITCKDNGVCTCKSNFDGDKCDQCKVGFYNFPICEKCNFNPAGVVSSFTGCPPIGGSFTISCKSHVEGKECEECKDLFWNLQQGNPEGCDGCGCNTNGTIGRLGSCDSKSGQCVCKPSATSRKCDQCADGYFNLKDDHIFGCIDCECDVGGSISSVCNKKTGQCACQTRVTGTKCKEPLTTYYFPTLHQFQTEIEDGQTPELTPVRYGFDAAVFPGYSWKGYAVFSPLQNETVHEVSIQNPSIYRIILRYINPNSFAILGTISVTPETGNGLDTEQKFQVLFKPTRSPAFATVAGLQGNIPSPFVLNPGNWILKIKNEKSLFLDYFVLIPAEYYEATQLVFNISNPCNVDKNEICRHYMYPNLSGFDQKKGSGGYINNGDSQSPIQIYFEDPEEKFGKQKMPTLSDAQPEITFDMAVKGPGKYVLVIVYVTHKDQNTSTIQVAIPQIGNQGVSTGFATIYNCRYTMLCREIVLDNEGKVAVFNFNSNFVKLILKGSGNGVAIDSIVAVPRDKWSLDYVRPKPSCIRKENNCVPSTYISPPDSKRIDFKTGNENRINKILPSTIFDNNTELVYLDHADSMVDIHGQVPKPGPYVFVIHYYQPDFAEFDMDVIVQNGLFYEAKLPVQHCPSNTGCRSVVRQTSGNSIFQLNENFVLTLKEPNHKSIWLHYVLVIPSSLYKSNIITELPFDQTARFISQCGQNSFYLDTKEEGFCRDSAFSITTKYNHGTLPCQCDFDGSSSLECDKYGGQCPCLPNVIGRRCDACRTGYFGFPNCQSCNCVSTAVCDASTGACICPPNVHGEKCNQCLPYTFGFDPIIGCQKCNCNLYGVRNNNLQCNLMDGSCHCKENVEGRTCDRCSAGHSYFPHCEICECDLRGTTEEICNQTTAACFCKANVHGLACDKCKDGTFNLQADKEEGCTKCFCFGKTSRCRSSTLYTTAIIAHQNWIAANVKVNDSVEVESLPTPVQTEDHGLSLNLGLILGGITYFIAPHQYLGNKLTAYGNHLRYTLTYSGPAEGAAVFGPDVILYGAKIYLLHETNELPVKNTPFVFAVKLTESHFKTISGAPATREETMQVLQNLTAIYIKATYTDKAEFTKVTDISLEVGTPDYNPFSNLALSVEQCECPPNYVGLSCEECADGYYRVPNGPFGGYCIPCQCNGHASSCDKVTGLCHNCKHNTKGDHCEKCETGFYGNATTGTPNDCLICACPLPVPSNNFATKCDINEVGDKIICECIRGYTGERCEKCAAGYYGSPEITGAECVPCQCNGNIDPSDPTACHHVTGKCLKCLNNTSGDKCERCAPDFYGDAVNAKDCQPCACAKCGTKNCDHRTGRCTCHENVIGEKCDRCADFHYGFSTCQGCAPCQCDVASQSMQCDDTTGHCRCKEGVTGRTCDTCTAGYWKYTENGCTSCGCNTGYSIGVGCNVTTGLCECLPRVVGEKCDRCPYRNALIPNQGCIECDKCTHGLLDVTDELKTNFTPIFDQFKTESIGYFTTQRLKFINDSFHQLKAKIANIGTSQFDITPYEKNISTVETEAENMQRAVSSLLNDALSASKNGDMQLEKSQKIESLMAKVVDKSRITILAISNLAYSLETGAGPQVDYAVKEAERTLKDINSFEIDGGQIEKKDEVLAKAKKDLIDAHDFSSPLNATVKSLDELKNNVDTFNNKLDELESYAEKAQKFAKETTGLNQKHKNSLLPERAKAVIDTSADANNALIRISERLKNSSDLLDSATINYRELDESNKKIKDVESKVNENVEKLKSELKSARDDVQKAKQHAKELENQAKILQTQKGSDSSEHALQAATSYKDIVTASDEALNATNEAKKNIEETNKKSEGTKDKINAARAKSADLLGKGQESLKYVQTNLNPELSSVTRQGNDISKILNETEAKVDNIRKQLEKGDDLNRLSEKLKTLDPDAASMNARNYKNSVQYILDILPTKVKETEGLRDDRYNKQKAIVEAGNFVNKAESETPKIPPLISKMKDQPGKLNETIDRIGDDIERIRDLVSMAKDLLAVKVTLGVNLKRNTALELPVPSTMLDQGSSSDISLYFKTAQRNALLLFIGNEIISRQKRDARKTKTDDFLALEIQNGYLKLTVNLGEAKPTSVVVPDKFVADNVWYNVKIGRTGKSVNVTVTEQTEDNKQERRYSSFVELPGVFSMLNLDKEVSKFFVGGVPPSFEAHTVIQNPTFDGHVEGLTIDGIPIGLWNFAALHRSIDVPPSKAINGTKDRDVLTKTQTTTGCRFMDDGYIVLETPGPALTDRADIVFRFKTSSLNGLLFLEYKGEIFTAIELINGYIYFKYNRGKGVITLHTPTVYNDGAWHSIEASRYYNSGILKVDGNVIDKIVYTEKDIISEPQKTVYVGGFRGEHKIEGVTKKSFEGCIDGFQINGGGQDLTRNLNAHGIVPGCPEMSSKFVSFEGKGNYGYILWPRADLVAMFSHAYILELTLRIKTKAKDGMMAYGTDGKNAFSLVMNDGEIIFKIGGQEARSGANVKYNDNKWHNIAAFYDSSALHLLIDDVAMFKSTQSASQLQYMLPGKLYLGTVPSQINQTASAEEPFVGCIADATLNGVVVNFNEIVEGYATIGKCSGPNQQIGSSSNLPNVPQISSSESPVVPTAIDSTQEPPVTVAPGCLPLNPAADPDLTKDSGYRFGTAKQSALTFDFEHHLIKQELKLSMDMKTIFENGIIFYVTQPQGKDFVGLYLKDAKLYLQFKCASNEKLLSSEKNVNQAEWHTIEFGVNRNRSYLAVDGEEVDNSDVGCKQINVGSPFYVGGMDNPTLETATGHLNNFNKTFVGCLRNFKLNNNAVGNPARSTGVIPCSNKVEEGTYFSAKGGYILLYERFRVARSIDISMDIKPRNLNGLLIAVHSKNDYLVLQMVNGSINFTVESGNGPISAIFQPANPAHFCDGKWHNIVASKVKNFIILKIDDQAANTSTDGGSNTLTDTNHPLYVGGYPPALAKSTGILTEPQYVGCIRNLKISTHKIESLSSYTPYGNVMFNVCPTI